MHIGGVQKSLVNLLKETASDYDITLLLFYKGGALLKDIPENVKVIETRSPFKYLGMTKNDVKGHPLGFIIRSLFAVMARLFGISAVTKIMSVFQKNINGYDVAVSFLHSGRPKVFYGGCNEFVVRNISAEKKISFIHCDYKTVSENSDNNRKLYEHFDVLAACSEGCKNSFLSVMPEFADRVTVVPNCSDFEDIRAKALSGETVDNNGRMNIVTVARLGKEKGVTRAVNAISELDKSSRDKIHYYIIGQGTEYAEIASIISEKELDDVVTLCGEKNNPYGYIRSAELLLIPSVSEAAPMVIAEAACLGTPILSTETSSADDMIEKSGFGIVCENSAEGIKDGLEKIILDPDILKKFIDNIKNTHFDNSVGASRFAEIIQQER